MPYNTTAIMPSEQSSGTSALPLARVKKIIRRDEDIEACTPGANFLITIATEMFIQHLTEQALQMARSERKPRRNIQYKDLSNAVSRYDSLEFLTDVIPKTITYSAAVQSKHKQQNVQDGGKGVSDHILNREAQKGSSAEERLNGESLEKAEDHDQSISAERIRSSSIDSDMEMAA